MKTKNADKQPHQTESNLEMETFITNLRLAMHEEHALESSGNDNHLSTRKHMPMDK